MKPFAHTAAVVGSRFLLLVFLLLVALAQTARAQLPTLPSCGGEGERVCHPAEPLLGVVGDWEYYVQSVNDSDFVKAVCDRGLKPSNGPLRATGTCVNDTRQQAQVDSWTDFALRNQENLGIDEPINWVSRLGTHNAYNTHADGYIDPNNYWSMTDQLRQGSRHFQLDLHWYNGHLRLCHGQASGLGCSLTDRLYAYGIKEIADWLDANPGEIMTMDFEDYAQPQNSDNHHDNYVNDPLAAYLGSKILTPAEWPNYSTRLPTKREMLAAGKQVLILASSGNQPPDTHGGIWIFNDTLYFGIPSGVVLDPATVTSDLCCSGAPNLDFLPEVRVCRTGVSTNRDTDLSVFATGHNLAQFSWIGEERVLYTTAVPIPPPRTFVTEAWVELAAHCRISVEGLDDVNPPGGKPNDHRHQAAVWSWLEGDAGNNGDAALLLYNRTPGYDRPWNRWVSRSATDVHPFMCARPRSESGGPPESWYASGEGYDWKVTSGSGTWFEGGQRCLAEFGPNYVFSVPVSGYQNVHASLQLTGTTGATGGAWINYNDIKNPGSWDINRRPIADPGPDQTVECNAPGTGTVTVNGSASYDPDGDSITNYAWTGALGSATGPVATFQAPLGVSTIRLVVDDGYSGVGSADLRVTVRDTTPPVIRSAAANPTSSWPPNHKMFPVRLSVDARDTCDPNPRSRVVSVTSNEGTPADWQIVGPLEVMLRSERSGKGGDRVYTIWIQSTDASGNASTPRAVTVTIAHDQGKSKP
ncbi:MAG TPA: hypothetical protein VGR55_17220 [Candidatus Acidoferrum sp.]|nr:hypothetical protein [Candidatus Acidoferrum sp.]